MTRKKDAESSKIEKRKLIKNLAVAGIKQNIIAEIVGETMYSIRKNYLKELTLGAHQATANVAMSLYNNALKGNVTAQIFWLKTRGQWRETIEVKNKISYESTSRDIETASDADLIAAIINADSDEQPADLH